MKTTEDLYRAHDQLLRKITVGYYEDKGEVYANSLDFLMSRDPGPWYVIDTMDSGRTLLWATESGPFREVIKQPIPPEDWTMIEKEWHAKIQVARDEFLAELDRPSPLIDDLACWEYGLGHSRMGNFLPLRCYTEYGLQVHKKLLEFMSSQPTARGTGIRYARWRWEVPQTEDEATKAKVARDWLLDSGLDATLEIKELEAINLPNDPKPARYNLIFRIHW